MLYMKICKKNLAKDKHLFRNSKDNILKTNKQNKKLTRLKFNKFTYYILFIIIIIFATIVAVNYFSFRNKQKIEIIDPNVNTMKIIYPSTDYKKLNKKIKKFINGEINDFEKITLNSNKTTYYLIINYKGFYKSSFISYIFFTESYTKGAHPIHLIYTICYDKENDKFITIEDLININPNILQEMSKYTYDTFSNTNLYKRQDLKSWLKEGTLPVKKNFQNFLFSKDGLIIYFPRYQIGPYYYGDKNILIPYNKLHLNI